MSEKEIKKAVDKFLKEEFDKIMAETKVSLRVSHLKYILSTPALVDEGEKFFRRFADEYLLESLEEGER